MPIKFNYTTFENITLTFDVIYVPILDYVCRTQIADVCSSTIETDVSLCEDLLEPEPGRREGVSRSWQSWLTQDGFWIGLLALM